MHNLCVWYTIQLYVHMVNHNVCVYIYIVHIHTCIHWQSIVDCGQSDTLWTEDVFISGVVLYTNTVFGTDKCVLLPYYITIFQGVLDKTERCKLLICMQHNVYSSVRER